jgi:hypothetical protein
MIITVMKCTLTARTIDYMAHDTNDRCSGRSLTIKTDLRWFSMHRTKVKLLPSIHRALSCCCAFQFFSDAVAFEKVMCRCGQAGIKPGPEERIRHHISFCNVSYLHLDFQEMRELGMDTICSAFKCLRTLTELHIRCSDGDMDAPPTVVSWTFHVPTMKTIQFESARKSVSACLLI